MLINWWLIGTTAVLAGDRWYELSQSKVEAFVVGAIAAFCACFVLDISGWL
jgi:hypothetical protein